MIKHQKIIDKAKFGGQWDTWRDITKSSIKKGAIVKACRFILFSTVAYSIQLIL